jgi:hypothetical protein
MIYNFRIDRSQRDFLLEELNKNRILYQGWGNFSLDSDSFVEDTKTYYSLKSTRTPSSLVKIKSFKENDMLLIPHLPENGLVTIVIVDSDYPSCYKWKTGQPNHLNHGIRVKKVYGLNGNISMYNHMLVEWYGKLTGLRLPVLALSNMDETAQELINILEADPEARIEKSSMNDYLSDQTNRLIDTLLSQLQQLSPSRSDLSFEKVCEELLTHYNYETVRRNYYNSKNGDADLVLKKLHNSHSPFEIGEYYLFVQIKKHKGETDDQAVDQLINIMEDDTEYFPAKGCVISLAETFSESAIIKAAEAGIQMINGATITKLLAQNELSKVNI